MTGADVVNIRRIVIGFADAAAIADDAIATAAELAHLLDAELMGLFVEDALLFDAGALPWLRTLEPRRLVWRSLTPAQLAESHALAARAVERHLLGQAAAFGVAAGFQVVRGDPATTLALRSEPSDLLVLAEPAEPFARAVHPYPSLVRAVAETASAVLYVPHGARPKTGPVVALARAPDDAALALAASVAHAFKERLVVLAVAPPEGELAIAQAARALAGRDCITLRLDERGAGDWSEPARHALAPFRERLLTVSRTAVGDDLAGYLRLAGERSVPLLLAPV
ncbi:MAG TPA: hypothetical protein VMG60_21860 [Burkholderiaceae bacterium]|nr:hypothetical protein [Burkholderiaceae bacterium]